MHTYLCRCKYLPLHIYVYIFFEVLCTRYCPEKQEWTVWTKIPALLQMMWTHEGCPYNPRIVLNLKSSGPETTPALLTVALNYKSQALSAGMGGYSPWLGGEKKSAQSRFCHNRWASLRVLSFIDNAVIDGIIRTSEELPRRLCWHLRFILIFFCRFYNEHLTKHTKESLHIL